MAFQKKTWLARLGQGLNKFIFNGGTKVTLDSSPDVVTQEGTPLSADNMNDLEQRIDDAITSLNVSTQTIDLANSSISASAFQIVKTLPSVTDKTAIGICGYTFPRDSILNITGVYVDSTNGTLVINGYNGGSARTISGYVYVFYQ